MKTTRGAITAFATSLALVGLLMSSSLPLLVRAAPTTVDPNAQLLFSQNRQLWERGNDIRLLQVFLNTHGFVIAQSGLGSPGNETTLFGPRTYRALIRFQAASGLPATGFFGPLTRAKFGVFLSTSSTSSTSASTQTAQSNVATTTSLIHQPLAPGNGYTPGFGGGGGATGGNGSNAPTPSTAPPVISAISVATTTTTATATWATDKAATSKVVYGTTSAYGSATSSAVLATYHAILTTGLASTTSYHFAVVSADAQGNTTTSTDQTFTTATNSTTPSNTGSPLGINLQTSTYFTPEQPFIDIFKTAYTNETDHTTKDGWLTQTVGTFDTAEESKVSLDANGYPICICSSGNQSVTFTLLSVAILHSQPAPYYYPSGQYVLLYDGQGTITYGWDAVKNTGLSTPAAMSLMLPLQVRAASSLRLQARTQITRAITSAISAS